ncbi:hypothetical protein M918_22820 [Clostridium sp. BL8]|uniref:hypothetical protein n=1 Tax=Clostridium sp. BL8 TaxID=1354301 RepID=UPI000389DBAC|nr:hypothetical protein [Clostridium sp. BL8]EQB88894.1 hypothetical protein M918_22820 [Clostridium sp. BL8]
MITNKLLALVLSLFTAGGSATGAASGTVANNIQLPKFPTTAVVQKQISNPQNGGQTINLPLNLKNSCDAIAPTQVQLPKDNQVVADKEDPVVQAPITNGDTTVETPKTEVPKVEVPVKEQPKVEAPVTEEPKAEAPVKEQPKTETDQRLKHQLQHQVLQCQVVCQLTQIIRALYIWIQ